jgi:hypothetical protein
LTCYIRRVADMFGKLRQWLACDVMGYLRHSVARKFILHLPRNWLPFKFLSFMRGSEFHETVLWSFCVGAHQGHSIRHLDPV